MFAGGTMLLEARWPNAGKPVPEALLEFNKATMDEGTTTTRIVDDALPDVDLAGANVWVGAHKRWYCWTGAVRARAKSAVEIEDNPDSQRNPICKPGGDYDLFKARSLLGGPGEQVSESEVGVLRYGSNPL